MTVEDANRAQYLFLINLLCNQPMVRFAQNTRF